VCAFVFVFVFVYSNENVGNMSQMTRVHYMSQMTRVHYMSQMTRVHADMGQAKQSKGRQVFMRRVKE
jgi:hypothetical protein